MLLKPYYDNKFRSFLSLFVVVILVGEIPKSIYDIFTKSKFILVNYEFITFNKYKWLQSKSVSSRIKFICYVISLKRIKAYTDADYTTQWTFERDINYWLKFLFYFVVLCVFFSASLGCH